MKKIKLIGSLNEQREVPNNSLTVCLKKNFPIEILDWDEKTEKVKIHSRYLVKKFEWVKDKKKAILILHLKKVDLKKYKKQQKKLAEKIVEKYYKQFAYTFLADMIEATSHKLVSSNLTKEEILKKWGEALEKKRTKKAT